MSFSVALGAYASTIFTIMAVYSKTALGMGLTEKFTQFFDSCATFRLWGYRSFLGTILLFNASWVLSLILNYEGELRWWMAAPAVLVGIVGLAHYKLIMDLAGALIFS